MTLDVISRIGFGEPFGSLLADRDIDGFCEAGNVGLPVASYILGLGLAHVVIRPWVLSGSLVRARRTRRGWASWLQTRGG